MTRIVAIVEGHGEVEAVPILVRRLAETAGTYVDVPKPIRTKRQQLMKDGEFERALELAARKSSPSDGILVLLDADADCPRDLARSLLERAHEARADRADRVRVVLAKVEYEAWLIAGLESIAGQRGISNGVVAPEDPEAIQDAKGWLSRQMVKPRSYREVLDQPALTARFDICAARARSRSFDKLCRDVTSLIEGMTP